ncbi:hypothetical protein [Streptomyces alfalfae]|uniref:hypothetical protein n=1 Tax=Streptomyces alfalfae TaxID=1642299 RepID=UPI002810A793|nr:hypothetical protein [Streptomyces alfalfae]
MTDSADAREARRLVGMAHHFTYGDGADPAAGAALAAEALVFATLALAPDQVPATAVQLETEPAVAYVYRAAWGMTPLGTYTNAEAARMHCEADAINHNPEFEGRVFDWLADESDPDAPQELVVGKDGVEDVTDYMVTRITVASEYDPEADA